MQRDTGGAEVLDAQAGGEHVLADLVHDEDFPCRQLCARRRGVEGEERLESGPLLVAQSRSGGRHGGDRGPSLVDALALALTRQSRVRVEHRERERRDFRLFSLDSLFRSIHSLLPFQATDSKITALHSRADSTTVAKNQRRTRCQRLTLSPSRPSLPSTNPQESRP